MVISASFYFGRPILLAIFGNWLITSWFVTVQCSVWSMGAEETINLDTNTRWQQSQIYIYGKGWNYEIYVTPRYRSIYHNVDYNFDDYDKRDWTLWHKDKFWLNSTASTFVLWSLFHNWVGKYFLLPNIASVRSSRTSFTSIYHQIWRQWHYF